MVADRQTGWLKGPFGGLILRPWFDHLALSMMVKGYFPTSRLWAAAEVAGKDPERFFREAGMTPVAGAERARVCDVLALAAEARKSAEDAENRWRDVLFSGERSHAPAEAEHRRRTASFANMAQRKHFGPWRRKVSPVRFDVASPRDTTEKFGDALGDPHEHYQPGRSEIAVSRSIENGGVIERWLRFDCPLSDVGGSVWAHVFEPQGGFDHTVVMCHGVGMEAEFWDQGLHMAPALVERGVRVIEPEAPWHSRRRPFGNYGGEPFLARGILGAIEMFGAHVREIGTLVAWARDDAPGRVAVGGISLGALNSQLVAAHAGSWPQDMRPDAALLITTTDRLDVIAFSSGFAKGLKATHAMRDKGWTSEAVRSWLPLVAPGGEPGIDPDRIVMALGSADNITPFQGGREFARRWRLPPENILESWQGHFSKAIGLARNPAPFDRLCAILRS